MKRPIFVRPLSDAERETLEAGLRSPDAFTLRRCQILLASNRGKNAYRIAHELGCNPQTARNAIHAFNEKGFPQALGPPVPSVPRHANRVPSSPPNARVAVACPPSSRGRVRPSRRAVRCLDWEARVKSSR